MACKRLEHNAKMFALCFVCVQSSLVKMCCFWRDMDSFPHCWFLLRCGPGAYIIWQPKYQAREVGKLLLGGSSLFGGDIILGGSSCCVKQLVQGIQTRFQKHIKFRGIFFKFERAKQRSPPLSPTLDGQTLHPHGNDLDQLENAIP